MSKHAAPPSGGPPDSRQRQRFRQLIDWIGSHELSVQIAFLVIVAAIWGFVKIADEVAEGDTAKFDTWAVQAMRRPGNLAEPIGPLWLAEVGRDLTALGGVACLSLLTTAVVGWLWLRNRYRAAILVLVATLGGLAVSSFLKWFFERPRPAVVPHLARVYTSSFPSGHSMLAATVFLTLGALLASFVEERRLKAYFLFVAVVLTILIGISRVYLGVHYPTDVLAGWTAGMAWAVACWLVARLLQRRGAVEKDASQR